MKIGLIYVRTKSFDQGHTLGPNGVGYLASYVEQKLGLKDTYIEFYFDKLMDQKPDIVGISSVTETYPIAIDIAKGVKNKNPNIPVIVGGAHITALPQTLHSSMDVGVISEGEAQFSDVVELILNNNLNPDKLKDIEGICFHDGNNNIIDTGKREWINNLDIIPPPKREAIANIHLRSNDFPIHQSLMTNRGCPFKCTFCSAVALWERTRYHSLERVIMEIEDIIRDYPDQKMIPITDDLFALHKKRLKQMVDMMRSEKLLGKAQFTCHARASCFDEETCSLLSEMGVRVACFGFESGNDRMLKVLKGGSTAKQNQKAIDLCNKYGISVLGNFIAAAPTEKLEELGDTYWFIRRNKEKLWRSNVCISTPFPGTAFWFDSIKNGLIPENFDNWEVLDLNFEPDKTIYMNDQYSKEEFEKIFPLFLETNVHASISKQNYVLKTIQEDYVNIQFENISKMISKESNVLEISGLRQSIKEYTQEMKTFDKVSIENGKVDLPDKENFYDYIIIPFTLEQLQNPLYMIKNLKSILNKNGKVIIISYNMSNISIFIELLQNTWNYIPAGIHQKQNLSFFDGKILYKQLKEIGFKNISIDFFRQNNPEYADFYNNIFGFLSKFLPVSKFIEDSNAISFVITCSIGNKNEISEFNPKLLTSKT